MFWYFWRFDKIFNGLIIIDILISNKMFIIINVLIIFNNSDDCGYVDNYQHLDQVHILIIINTLISTNVLTIVDNYQYFYQSIDNIFQMSPWLVISCQQCKLCLISELLSKCDLTNTMLKWFYSFLRKIKKWISPI